jgi:hypothetical protein
MKAKIRFDRDCLDRRRYVGHCPATVGPDRSDVSMDRVPIEKCVRSGLHE